jgi:integrase
MRALSLSISWHKGAKQFVRYVGYAIGRDGKPKAKCWYLGEDEATAIALAARIRRDWMALKAAGATVWPSAYLDAVQRASDAQIATVGRLANGLTAEETVNGQTVAEVRSAYLAEQRARMEAGQLSTTSYRGVAHRFAVMLDRLPTDLAISNRPVRSIGENELVKIILYWASLPMGRVGNQSKQVTTGARKAKGMKYQTRQKRTAKRIGAGYAKDILASLKALFAWAHETERWDKPRRFDKLFRVKFPKVHVEAQRFTVDELATVYAACQSNRHRLWMLLALNCGCDRMGLATLDWSMIKGLDMPTPMVERLRHKTGVYSRHRLWIETADMLRQVPPPNRKGLVCLSDRGEPLLEQTPTRDRDAIRQAWRMILDRSGLPSNRRLSFGKLRKTGAWMTKTIGGLEVSEMYLAHVELGMNKHYAGRDWDKLDAALMVMRSQLSTMLGLP